SSPPPLNHSTPSGDLSDSPASSNPSSPKLPQIPTSFYAMGIAPSRKRSRSRSESPFDPEGPKPSQRIREEVFLEEFGEESETDGTLGAVIEEED
ncbi:hypothetical protein P7C70_g8652, partial [Phenoliferia sp. Uapishka_3]